MGELSSQPTPKGTQVFDLTSSGINRFDANQSVIFPNSRRISVFDRDWNFGMVSLDWKRRQVLMEVFNSKGEAVIQHRLEIV